MDYIISFCSIFPNTTYLLSPQAAQRRRYAPAAPVAPAAPAHRLDSRFSIPVLIALCSLSYHLLIMTLPGSQVCQQEGGQARRHQLQGSHAGQEETCRGAGDPGAAVPATICTA